MGSPVNLKSGLAAVGALRPQESNSQEPVALETTVIATGARPGDTAAKRQLFTEETQTVLVFENGAVIRLSAAVADGQLLFLSNKSTGKEVVAQVLRKRSFRPTNCYVDLEFTEPCPGFWGVEFPKAGVLPAGANTAAKLSADEDSESGPVKPAAPPSLQEVDRLKHEAAALQTQLKSLVAIGQNPAPDSSLQAGGRAAPEINAGLAKKEDERLEELFAMEAKQEETHAPKRLVAYPQKSAKPSEKNNEGKKWAIAAGVVIALAAGGAAAYRFGVFGGIATKTGANSANTRVAPSSSAAGTQAPATPSEGVSDSPRNAEATQPNMQTVAPKNSAVVSGSFAAKGSEFDSGDPNVVVRPGRPDSERMAEGSLLTSRIVARGGATSSKRQPEAALRSKSAGASRSGENYVSNENESATSGVVVPAMVPDGDGYVGPKLVHAVKSVTPTEALKNYVTGNVTVDALVDTTGHVKSVAVLSGPTKLRETAVKEMKQYFYEPAKRNGKAVPAHVQLSLQYWYEP